LKDAAPTLRTRPNRIGAIYRCFAKDGELIYIGVTDSPGARHASHKRDREWWPEVAEVEWTFFPTYGAAIDAERDAIETEQPKYNTIGVS
jgi:excinuclease UvrABC nuclease subunit